jgi:hypothetical protein
MRSMDDPSSQSRGPVGSPQLLSSYILLTFKMQPPKSATSASPFLDFLAPHTFIEAMCMSVIGVTCSSSDVSYPSGTISFDPSPMMDGLNTEQQDFIISPIHAKGFSKTFVMLDSTVQASKASCESTVLGS